MRFALIAGLVLRHGARTIELVRQLSDDEYQFEDAITRRPFTIKRLLLLKRIWDRTYEVIVDGAGGGCTPSPKEWRGGLDSLTPKVRMEIERRLAYLNSMSKGHVTRGQRARLSQIIARVAERRKDKRPPSPSTLMTWARKFQTSGLNPLALRSGNAHRIRQPRIHPLMRDLLSWGLRTVWLTRDRFSLQHTLDCILREAKKLVAQQKLKAQEATFSLATLSRRTREIDLYRRIAAREGHARARMVCRTVMGGAGAAYPLQRVEVDHTPLNWVVVCDRTGLPLGRPLLTVIIDSYSNYVLGLYLSFYGAGVSSVSGVLRNAIKPKDDFTRGVTPNHCAKEASRPITGDALSRMTAESSIMSLGPVVRTRFARKCRMASRLAAAFRISEPNGNPQSRSLSACFIRFQHMSGKVALAYLRIR